MYLEEEDFGSSEGDESTLLPQGEEGIDEGIDEHNIPEQLIAIFGEDIIGVIEYYDFSDRSCISLLCFKDLGKSFIDDFVISLQNPPAESFFSENKEDDIIGKFLYIFSLLKLFEKNHIFSVERNDKLFEFCFKRGEELDMEIIEEYLCQIHTSTTDHESYIAPVMRFLKTGSILYLKDDSKLTIGSISNASKYEGEENQKKVMSQLQIFFRGVSSAFGALKTSQEYSYLIEGLYAQKGESYIDYTQRIVSLGSDTMASMLRGNDTHGFMEFFQTKLNGAGAISCIEYIEIIRDWVSERDDILMVDFDQSYNDLQTQLREGLQDIPEDKKVIEAGKKRRKRGSAREGMSENSYISELSPKQHSILRRISSSRSNNINTIVQSVLSSALHAEYPDHRMIYYKLLYCALKTKHCWTPEQRDLLSTLTARSEGSLSTKAIANAAYGLQSFQSTEVPQSLLHTITSDVNKQYKNFSDQHLRNTLMGLSDFRGNSEVQTTSSKLFGEIKERGTKSLNNLDVRYVTAAYHLHDRKDEIPSDFLHEYERIQGLPHKARKKERECFKIVKKRFTEAKNGVHIDGFELDIQLLSGLLNIEIDGDHHEDQKHYDDKRDLYLKDTHGIITRRYVLCQPTLEEELENFNIWLDKTLNEIQGSSSDKK